MPWISIASTQYGAVLLDKKKGSYWQVNDSGAFIVDGIEHGRSIDEIVNGLVETFDVDLQQAQEDVINLVRELVDLGMMKW
ncbi:MAG: lasso peptide biosynthesis PqqD family chaperone [Nitrososphaera sp.]